uniref:Uncharacterized protein n=1 Tax=Arundo donax TaxID=35708 RepID=A0A0A8XYQ2_ARUDO
MISAASVAKPLSKPHECVTFPG